MSKIMFLPVAFGIFLILPNVLGLSKEMQELADQLHQTCVEETGTNNEAIQNANKGIFAEDQSFKCYIKCLLEQMAVIDEDTGEIDLEAMIAVIPEELQEKTAPIIKKCGTKKGANICENAWLTHKCYYETDPSTYFLF